MRICSKCKEEKFDREILVVQTGKKKKAIICTDCFEKERPKDKPFRFNPIKVGIAAQ